MTEIFLIILIAHLLGDFYLQTNSLAEGKKTKFDKVAIHSLIYCAPFIALFGLWFDVHLIIPLAIIILSHFVIDALKWLFEKRLYNSAPEPEIIFARTRLYYIIDQILHLSVLMTLCLIFDSAFFGARFILPESLSVIPISASRLIRGVALLMLVLKPVNITFKNLFNIHKPLGDTYNDKPNTGALIGAMERILTVLFIALGQYAAIGFIFTAKSIARYKMLSDKEFAEYYLMGTLYSILSAVVLFLIVWK